MQFDAGLNVNQQDNIKHSIFGGGGGRNSGSGNGNGGGVGGNSKSDSNKAASAGGGGSDGSGSVNSAGSAGVGDKKVSYRRGAVPLGGWAMHEWTLSGSSQSNSWSCSIMHIHIPCILSTVPRISTSLTTTDLPSIIPSYYLHDVIKQGGELASEQANYRHLQGQKRELKRMLKRFDEDFQQRHGRLPKKADKEVLRPQYQRYVHYV